MVDGLLKMPAFIPQIFTEADDEEPMPPPPLERFFPLALPPPFPSSVSKNFFMASFAPPKFASGSLQSSSWFLPKFL
jgi:hypothetical protein